MYGGLLGRGFARVRDLLGRADLVCITLIAAFYLWRFATYPGTYVTGDGMYEWTFAHSLGFDGDLQLRNDYAACGDPWRIGVDEGGNRPANSFYFGPSLILAPVLAIVRRVVPLGPNPPAAWVNGCQGPWVTWTVAIVPLVGVLTLWLGYRAARRFTSERPALAAMLLVALCSPFTHFATFTVSYSHTAAALGVAVAWITFIRATEVSSRWRWLFAGMGVGLAALMRSQAIVFLAMPAIGLAIEFRRDLQEHRKPWRVLASGAIVLVGFASLFWIQLYVIKLLYGSPWAIPQGRVLLQPAHAHPWLLLFAARGGLVSWHPMMWLGLIGLIAMVARRSTRLMGIALGVPTLLDIYVNASVLDWHAAASFGARRLCTLAGPWVATSAIILVLAWQWLRARPARLGVFAATGWLLPWVIISLGDSTGIGDLRIPYDRPVQMPQLYGDGFRFTLNQIYDAVGNPLVLPASLVFSLRYGLHPRKFDKAATGGLFQHNFRDLTVTNPDAFEFKDPATDDLVAEGLERAATGRLVSAGQRGRMLTELAWPYITHVALRAHAAPGATVHLHIRNGSFWRRRDVADVVIDDSNKEIELAVSPGVFDSGINELVFTSDGDVTLERWRWIDRDTHDTSVHASEWVHAIRPLRIGR